MSMKKCNQPLSWGLIISIVSPLGVSYYGLVFLYIASTYAVILYAMFLWLLWLYAIYLLFTRPHDSRFVQIYMLIMGVLMLPWGLVLVITCIVKERKASKQRTSLSTSETNDG
ncbi:TPA: hypothetical protein QH394_001168 [Klebsiella aerogenes]|nr:hypothetical protein [Klebsiella aerogenes]